MFYNGTTVKQVDVPTLTGSFGILASHVPTLQVLKPGVVTVYAEDGTATKYFGESWGDIPGTLGGSSAMGCALLRLRGLLPSQLSAVSPLGEGMRRGGCAWG